MSRFSLTKDKDSNWHNPLLPKPSQQISSKKIPSSEQRAIYPWQSVINTAMKGIFKLGFPKKISTDFLQVLEEKGRIM